MWIDGTLKNLGSAEINAGVIFKERCPYWFWLGE